MSQENVEIVRRRVKELIDAGTSVIADVRLYGRGQTSGVPLEMHEVHVLALRDGKATRLREYRTKAEALETLGLSEQDARANS